MGLGNWLKRLTNLTKRLELKKKQKKRLCRFVQKAYDSAGFGGEFQGNGRNVSMRGWESRGKEPLNLQVWGWLWIPITATQRSFSFWAPCGGQKNVLKDVCVPSPCGGQNNIPNDILNPGTHKQVASDTRRLTAVMSARIPRWRLGLGPPARPGGKVITESHRRPYELLTERCPPRQAHHGGPVAEASGNSFLSKLRLI